MRRKTQNKMMREGDRMTAESSIPNDRHTFNERISFKLCSCCCPSLLMMIIRLSHLVIRYKLKDKNILFYKADIILVVQVVACFVMLHVFTKKIIMMMAIVMVVG